MACPFLLTLGKVANFSVLYLPLCPYAKKQFDKNVEYQDLL